MMNNYDENTLLNKISELENENAKLRVENQELRNKLEVKGLVNEDYNKPVSLNDYYLSKYLDTHDEIYKRRLDDIFVKEKNLTEELEKTNEALVKLKENDVDLSLEEINEEVERLEEKKQSLDEKLNIKIIELTDLIKMINNMLIDAKKYVVEYYDNLVQHLGKASNESTVEYMDFIISVARNSFYDQNVIINEQMTKASYLNRDLEDLDKQIEIEKNEIDEKIKALSDVSIKEQIALLDAKVEELHTSIEQNKMFKEELEELFKDIKQKHIKEILDQISYMQIRDVVNKEIANSLEELIEVDFASMLETIDTTTSAKIKKDTQIKSLNLRKAQLEQVQAEYDECLKEVDNIEGLENTINKNITQIEEYATFTMKAIESHANYQRIYDEYTSLVTKKDILEKEIDHLQDELISLKDTRREKVLDPYARPLINELNENIAQRESKLDRSKVVLEKLEKEIELYPKSKEEIVVVSVICEKIKCEKHLPDLYQKQRELTMAVEEKKERLAQLRKSLEEYDALNDKLAELVDESNN